MDLQIKYFEQQGDETQIDQQVNEWVKNYKPEKGKKLIMPEKPEITVTSVQVEPGVFEKVRFCTISYLELSEFQLQNMAMRGQMPQA